MKIQKGRFMKATTIAYSLACLGFLFAPIVHSQSETDRSRQEIRQVCAAEFAAYEAGPKDGLTDNVIGILPTRSDVEMLAQHRGAALQAITEGNVARSAGLIRACVAATRGFQVQNGIGNPDGARAHWMIFSNALARVESRARTENASQRTSSPVAPVSPSRPTEESGQTNAAACSEEIQKVQISSQQWSGSSDDVAAKLGQFQKALFEGRCAGHPEAAAYIASANRMIGYGGNPDGAGGGVLPLASSGNATASRDSSRTRKVHNPAADAKSCTVITGNGQMAAISTRGGWQLANHCGVPIEAFWCVVSPDGQCKNGGTWTIGAGNSWSIQEGGQDLRWGACKGRNGGGFDDGSNGEKYTCHLLSWN
ncbi:hypothetical protein N789_10500 [Arenimonas oryziterrae DSM 21050 = YC6267]|uniref:Ig-like domain-containing protein n=2 Tax=Arenimonas TaxID=490567 RepID=A0A091AU14_9GAMM|nr:hypothetical protein N789_10500 [Arenimonas oryziterrae DSM 21050 = YC6267]